MATASAASKNSEAAIFGRLWDGADRLTVPIARHVLTLRFGAEDEARMHALVEKNRAGKLSAAEREELDNFVKVGDLLAILHSKARSLLRRAPSTRNGHG